MTPRPPLPSGPYLVVGLARSGQALLKLLGDEARGVDRKQGDDTPVALEGMRCVIKSPGVPQDAPVIAAARERGIPVVGEAEFAWRLLPNEFVAVTGTNGKTTTVELLGAIHREAGVAAAVAGNVGTPLTSLVGVLDPAAVVVCELSSFQLEDTVEFAPGGAVLVNAAGGPLARERRRRSPGSPRDVRRVPRGKAPGLPPPGQRRHRGRSRRPRRRG